MDVRAVTAALDAATDGEIIDLVLRINGDTASRLEHWLVRRAGG